MDFSVDLGAKKVREGGLKRNAVVREGRRISDSSFMSLFRLIGFDKVSQTQDPQ